MTKRRPLAGVTVRAPLGSAVFLKSRLARYLESFRLATTPSRGVRKGTTRHARVAPGSAAVRGQRLFFDQPFCGHCFDDLRPFPDAIDVAFELGPNINPDMDAPTQNCEQIGICNCELITHQV